MGWRQGEIWLELEPRWFREVTEAGGASLEANAPSFSGLTLESLAAAIPDGLAQSRRRRAELRHRRDARKTRAAAAVIGPAVLLTLATPRLGTSRAAGPLAEDPPSQVDTFLLPPAVTLPPGAADAETFPAVRWERGTSRGLPYAGSLAGGTQLPLEGADWVTWNPVTDRVPNRPNRLYGNDEMIRKLIAVLAAYRGGSPAAPQVVVGDISFRGGGPMELHRSHQNGLDVDIYYPRRDGLLRAPTATGQVDRRLSQELLDAFVAVGVDKVFVGYATDLRGPGDVVVPYPNHEDHMHVRFHRPSE